MKKIIYIVGIGGRTGAMFGKELSKACEVIGIGMEKEVVAIKSGRLKAAPKKADINSQGLNQLREDDLAVEVLEPGEFEESLKSKWPDSIWMATRNPVGQAVKFYYNYFKLAEKMPALILSQNGLSAVDDARMALKEVLGEEAIRVRIVRVSLLNSVEAKTDGDKMTVEYKLPIRLGFGETSGGKVAELKEIFKEAGFEAYEFEGTGVKNMEYSKLFLNLMGMASAIKGMGVAQGFEDKKGFEDEVLMLREYILAVKANGGKLVELGYPVGMIAGLMGWPMAILLPLRKTIAGMLSKGRNSKPKDLLEIDYYNGEAVRLGKKAGMSTKINEEIVRKAKEINNRV